MNKAVSFCFLAGAWLCGLGFVKLGLIAFVIGGLPGLRVGGWMAWGFMAANMAGIIRVIGGS